MSDEELAELERLSANKTQWRDTFVLADAVPRLISALREARAENTALKNMLIREHLPPVGEGYIDQAIPSDQQITDAVRERLG